MKFMKEVTMKQTNKQTKLNEVYCPQGRDCGCYSLLGNDVI